MTQTSSSMGKLSESHRQMLRDESAISDEVIAARGYRTVTNKRELAELGFARTQQLAPGLLLPVFAPDGSNGLYQFRPNAPRANKQGKLIKYETIAGAAMRLDCPPLCRRQLADPSIPLWITEGVKKGDSLVSHGFCAAVLLGVWNFKGTNDFGSVTVLADFDFIAWKDNKTGNGRAVRICFDSDVMQKSQVRKALERLTEILERKGAIVSAVYLPDIEEGKTGVDDFLRLRSKNELEKLVTAPKPLAQTKPPVFELLDAPPAAMRRPLQIIDNHAHAATWLHMKKTIGESLDENGNIVRHNPPKEEISRELLVLRDDGKLFGYGQADSLDALGFAVELSEPVPEKLLLQKSAVEFYRAGKRKNAIDVFHSVQAVFDRFLDFERSLADQEMMSELAACYTLATWFTEAFNVVGYAYSTGERGSGKTQLLVMFCELSFLGQFIQASSSLATLRDLADYGAFLGFDDAEQVSSKNFDPDKRNLILAGNRRGSQITMKEPVPNSREWRTRYVNTFCPRGFSAIHLPDATLGSRTITFPLVRTADKRKGDADPLDETCWTQKPNEIRLNLWLIALAHLSEMREFDQVAASRATLTGRNLEAWRGVLAVATMLDAKDENGDLRREFKDKKTTLFERLNCLSIEYQQERAELEAADITRLVLRTISALITGNTNEPIGIDELRAKGNIWTLQTKDITERAQKLIEDDELDFDPEFVTSRRIGRCIGKLRLPPGRQAGTGKRGWQIKLVDLEKLLLSFGLLNADIVNSETDTQTQNVTDVTDVTVVTDSSSGECDISDICDVCDVSSESTKPDKTNATPTEDSLFDISLTEPLDAVNKATTADYYTFRCWACETTVSNQDSHCSNCEQNLNDLPF